MTVPFGKWKGYMWHEVPTEYLAWMCRVDSSPFNRFPAMEEALKEWERRGLPPQLILTSHAVKRARWRAGFIFREKRNADETFRQWLTRVFNGVLRFGTVEKKSDLRKGIKFKYTRYEYIYKGWKFVTQGNAAQQTLVTVYKHD